MRKATMKLEGSQAGRRCQAQRFTSARRPSPTSALALRPECRPELRERLHIRGEALADRAPLARVALGQRARDASGPAGVVHVVRMARVEAMAQQRVQVAHKVRGEAWARPFGRVDVRVRVLLRGERGARVRIVGVKKVFPAKTWKFRQSEGAATIGRSARDRHNTFFSPNGFRHSKTGARARWPARRVRRSRRRRR